MKEERIQSAADALFESEKTRNPIPPLTENDDISVDDAYHIQLLNVRRAESLGYKISGKKIGLTSPGIQRQLGVSEPDYGHLFLSMDCPEGIVDTSVLIQPKIEAELAFVLKADLSGGKITSEDVKNATEYVVAAFEIVDSRVADWRIKLEDTVADNASSGRYILGSIHHLIDEIDLPSVEMKLFKNGGLVGEGKGSAVLGDPCESVAWLANRLWDYGVVLKKGEIILSGAFSAAPTAEKGDIFEASFTSFGTVKAKFI